METLYHCGEHRLWFDQRHIEAVPCAFAEEEEEGQLRPSIAFAKRVDGVEVGEESCGGGDELFSRTVARQGPLSSEANSKFHLIGNMLRKAEHRVILGNAYGSMFACPVVNILK